MTLLRVLLVIGLGCDGAASPTTAAADDERPEASVADPKIASAPIVEPAAPSASASTPTSPPTGTSSPTRTPSEAPDTEVHEAFGAVHLGMGFEALRAAMPKGAPDPIIPPVQAEDGQWLWGWDGQGLSTVLEGTSEHGPWTVSVVQLSGRSKLKTSAGIGLRATRKAVETAYPAGVYDPFGKRDELTLVKLGPKEWLFITYENDRVARMELRDPADCAGDCS